MVAQIGRCDRTEEVRSARKWLAGMIVKGLAKVLLRDWCVELEEDGKVSEDHGPPLSGRIFLMERSTASDQAN